MPELFSYGPKGIKQFLKAHWNAVLYTIILHLMVAIILVIAKVEGLKEDRELGVALDFTEELTLEELMEQEQVEVPAEWIEQVIEARAAASNRAVNLNDEVNEEISTEDYVNQLLDELEAEKGPEFLEEREKWKEIISSQVYEQDPLPMTQDSRNDQEPFTGPTNITFKFNEPPLGRAKYDFPVPIYECEGSAEVEVSVVVDREGVVQQAEVTSVESVMDPSCFTEAAKRAARESRFMPDASAPGKHRAIITYQFVAQ